MPAATVTFAATPDTLTLNAPSPGARGPVTVPGNVARTAGGTLLKYQTGPGHFEALLRIELNNTEKNSLESFFRTHWRDNVTYTDENATAFTVQFMDTMLEFEKAAKNDWATSIRLNMSAILK